METFKKEVALALVKRWHYIDNESSRDMKEDEIDDNIC